MLTGSAKRFAGPFLLLVAMGIAGSTAAVAADMWRDGGPSNPVTLSDPYQDTALADGTVTRAEYDGAIANAVTCMRDAGIDAHAVNGAAGGIETFGAATDDQLAAGHACVAEHAERVSFAWATQNRPDDAKRAAAQADATACFLANGGDLAGRELTRPVLHEILTDGSDGQVEAMLACLDANLERYGFGF